MRRIGATRSNSYYSSVGKEDTEVKHVHNGMPFNKVTVLFMLVVLPYASVARGQCAHGDFDGSGDVGLPDSAAFVDCLSLSGP